MVRHVVVEVARDLDREGRDEGRDPEEHVSAAFGMSERATHHDGADGSEERRGTNGAGPHGECARWALE
jgi:hypothetical protein